MKTYLITGSSFQFKNVQFILDYIKNNISNNDATEVECALMTSSPIESYCHPMHLRKISANKKVIITFDGRVFNEFRLRVKDAMIPPEDFIVFENDGENWNQFSVDKDGRVSGAPEAYPKVFEVVDKQLEELLSL